MRTTNENSGKLQRLCIQASKILATRNLPLLVCNFSANSFCGLQHRQLVGSVWLLQLSCKNRTVFLFSFLCRHYLAGCLSPQNNFSLSHTEFREIFFLFHRHGTLFVIPTRTTSHLVSSLIMVTYDGQVSRLACFHWSSNWCLWSQYISVRNCGAFYIYHISGTPTCDFRYYGTS